MSALNGNNRRILLVTIFLLLFITPMTGITRAQEDNLCRSADVQFINLNQALTGTLDAITPAVVYCFEAERGNEITITVAPTSPNLTSAFVVATPFVNATGGLVDEPLLDRVATAPGTPYQGTVTIDADGTYIILVEALQDTQGSFQIAIEVSGGNVLGAQSPAESTEPASTGEGITNVIFGETNLCETAFSESIAYGDTVTDTASALEPVFYCFDGAAGDIVTVEIGMAGDNTDVPVGFLVVEPLWAQTTQPFAENVAQDPEVPVSSEILLDSAGQYVIIVFSATDTSESFELSISSVEGNVYDCSNEPLNTLTSRQWGILDAETGVSLIEVNVACNDRMAVAALGGAAVAPYSITQEDEFFFLYQNRVYVTADLNDEIWVIEDENSGIQYALTPLSDADACDDERLTSLIGGSWRWQIDPSQVIVMDFTCNGPVLMDIQPNDPLTAPYELTDNQLVITLGQQELVLEEISISESTISATFQGVDFEITNTVENADTGE